MSLDIRYSDSLKGDEGCFHNFRYTNEQLGGNRNETTFAIENECGNNIDVEFEHNGEQYKLNLRRVKITMYGGVENGDFLGALQTILEAEKISDLLRR